MKLICCSSYYMALVRGLPLKFAILHLHHLHVLLFTLLHQHRPHSITKTFLNRGLPASRLLTAFPTSRNAYFSIMHFTPCVKAN